MRLIDIDDVLITERNPDVFVVPETAYGWNECLKIFRNAPTVDAVPVVRCKDCKHWGESAASKKLGSCDCDALLRSENFFCAAGERRGNDG